MASRYPTRDEWAAANPGDDYDDPPERPASRKPRKLQRKPHMSAQRGRRWRTSNVNVGGLLPESAYLALKRDVFARAGKLCERCGLSRNLTPHHRKLLSQGGEDRASNLAALCPVCHDWCHDHPVESWNAGWIVPSYGDPADWPMLLADDRTVYLTDDGTYVPA